MRWIPWLLVGYLIWKNREWRKVADRLTDQLILWKGHADDIERLKRMN